MLLFRWRPHLPAKHAAILSAPGRMIHAYDGSAVAEVHFVAVLATATRVCIPISVEEILTGRLVLASA